VNSAERRGQSGSGSDRVKHSTCVSKDQSPRILVKMTLLDPLIWVAGSPRYRGSVRSPTVREGHAG
jgi:hypothetical protein